jgi:hypothetical protein
MGKPTFVMLRLTCDLIPSLVWAPQEVRLVLRDVGAPSAVHDVALRFAQGHVSLHEGTCTQTSYTCVFSLHIICV